MEIIIMRRKRDDKTFDAITKKLKKVIKEQ